ncbi:hypothetical protein K8R33_01015 [archaeon]|nr:hypothetical protein [archaeon]
MFPTQKKGIVIAIDGPPKAGKNIQTSIIKDYLNFLTGNDIYSPSEPWASLESKDRKKRIQYIKDITLQEQTSVILYAYHCSSFAYMHAQGMPIEEIVKANMESIVPDLTFLLNAPTGVLLERSNPEEREKFETEGFLERLNQNFQDIDNYLAKLNRAREPFGVYPTETIIRINANQDSEEVFRDIRPHLNWLMRNT